LMTLLGPGEYLVRAFAEGSDTNSLDVSSRTPADFSIRIAAVVPEPATWLLALAVLLALWGCRWRR
jgi:hypothetical protein